jgi:hypothetical protein
MSSAISGNLTEVFGLYVHCIYIYNVIIALNSFISLAISS